MALLLSARLALAVDQLEEIAKRAGTALRNNDFVVAEKEYQAILAINPGQPEMQSNLGVALYMQGKYDRAESEFQKAARGDPQLFVPQYFLGVRSFKTNRYRQASVFLEAALAIKPDTQARWWLGATYVGLKDYDRGLHQYREILRQDPGHVDALYSIGKIYVDLMERSLKVLSASPGDFHYGLLLLDALTESESIEWRNLVDTKISPILQVNPSVPALHLELGVLRLRSGDMNEARRLFQEELKIDPSGFRAYYGLAQVSLVVGQPESFAENLHRAVSIRPEYFCPPPALQVNVTAEGLETALRGSQDQLAVQFLVAKLGRENSFCTNLVSDRERVSVSDKSSARSPQTLFREKRYEAVISRLDRSGALPGLAQSLLAHSYLETGQFEKAKNLAANLAASPKPDLRYDGHYLLTKSYQALALQTLSQIARIAPDSYRGHQLMGEAYLARMNFPAAVEEFSLAAQRQADNPELFYQLGRVYFLKSEWPNALTALRKTLELDPANAEASFLMGEIFLQTEQPADAASAFQAALRLDPSMLSARAELGKAFLRQRQWAEAAQQLELSSASDVGGELYYELFRAYNELKQPDRAKRALATSQKRRQEKLERQRSLVTPAESHN
jgi:tetratricopeptide (TPR) repeat protein